MIWNFFATSYGKGVVDGIDGTVKRAWSEVTKLTSQMRKFADVAQLCCPNIHVSFIPKEQITSFESPQQVLLTATQPNRSL